MTLLFVHGAGCTRDIFAEQLAAFPDAHAIALPGHGAPGGCTSIEGFADAVSSNVGERNLRDVVVCGHSMGGAVALELALRRSAWLRAVVLIGSGSRLRVSGEILTGLQTDFSATTHRIAMLLFADPTPERVTMAQAMLASVGPRQTLDDFTACNAYDATERLESVDVPLLALTGDRDVMTPPKYARFLADRVPNAKVRILDGAGHLAMLERPAQTNAELRAFVTSSLTEFT
jgi:pimeloyl-ACP methyl ester carboxylesterase